MTDFDVARFRKALAAKAIGRTLVYRPVVDTTMVVAAELAGEGAGHGTIVLADHQTAGRGRRGRGFHSPAGGNLYFTIVIRLEMELHRRLPVALPVAVARACAQQGVDARIKWPNDIWVGERKLCGMLIDAELPAGSGPALALAGIGINVNGDPTAIPELRDTATSLSRELGHAVDREELLACICGETERALALSSDSLAAAYRELSAVLGRAVVLAYPGGETREAFAEEIEPGGALVVRFSGGATEQVTAADVSLRPRPD